MSLNIKFIFQKSFLYLIPAILWAILIMFFLVIKFTDPSPTTIPFKDKMVHFLLFYIEAWLLSEAYYRQAYFGRNKQNLLIFSIIILSMYAGLTEIIQDCCVEDRTGEWADWLFDVLGGLIGFISYGWIRKTLIKKKK